MGAEAARSSGNGGSPAAAREIFGHVRTEHQAKEGKQGKEDTRFEQILHEQRAARGRANLCGGRNM